MDYHSNNVIQHNWSLLSKEIENNTIDFIGLKLKKQPKKISLLTRSLMRYIINAGVIPYKGAEIGLIVDNKDNNEEYIAKKNTVLFLIKSETSENIIKPIFSKNNYVLLESPKGTMSKFQISKNHINSINEYFLQLYKYLEKNNYLIGKLKFFVPEQLSNRLYNAMLITNKKNNNKLFILQKLINSIFDFEINVKNAAYLSSYRDVQNEAITNTLEKIQNNIDNLNNREKLKIAFIIECLIKSKRFTYANIDNQIVFLRFLSQLKSQYFNACSIFETSKKILENLNKQDIVGNNIDTDNNEQNSVYKQLECIKNNFTYDKYNSINVQFLPVCTLNQKDGEIENIETVVENKNNNFEYNQDLYFSQI